MKTFRILLAVFYCLMIAAKVHPQDLSAMGDSLSPFAVQTLQTRDFDFFSADEPLTMSLCFDFKQYLKTRKEPEYMDAILTLELVKGKPVTQKIEIKARGDVRRVISTFPPIKLKFKENSQDSAPIRRKGTLKLVTPCNQTTHYQNYVLKEYLAYRMLNLVTPYSFRTRLARIRYIDAGNPKRSFTNYGFLIENEKDMATRNDRIIEECKAIPVNHVNPRELSRVALFNYMIGNTDWAISCQHNVKILKSVDSTSRNVIPVAYDFDYSGFVGAEYSVPGHNVPVDAVTERYYMGTLCSREELQPIIDEFIGLKDEFINTINLFSLLPKRDQKDAVNYLDDFYRTKDYYGSFLSDLSTPVKQ